MLYTGSGMLYTCLIRNVIHMIRNAIHILWYIDHVANRAGRDQNVLNFPSSYNWENFGLKFWLYHSSEEIQNFMKNPTPIQTIPSCFYWLVAHTFLQKKNEKKMAPWGKESERHLTTLCKSRLCMKKSPFLFVRAWAMPCILYWVSTKTAPSFVC